MTFLLCACSFGGGSSGGSSGSMSQSVATNSVVSENSESGSSSIGDSTQTAGSLDVSSNKPDESQTDLEIEVPVVNGSQAEKSPEECTVEDAESYATSYAELAKTAADNAVNAETAEESEKYAKQAQEAAEHAKAIGTQFGDNITENANKLISEAQQSAEAAVNVSEEKKAFEEASRQADTGLSYTKEDNGVYCFSVGSLNYKVFIESENSVKVEATGSLTGLSWTKNYTKKGNQYYKTVDLGWIKYTIPAFIMDGLVKDNLQSFFENIVKDI
ncbi:MAG: hypothetical protein PUK76_03525 [Treponema sp.]|nr:hypothetical protein [Treponema sp.]MDY2923542.1 hypothetical protein [Treponema sp.]